MRRNAVLSLIFDLSLIGLFATFVCFYELGEGSFHPRDETTHVRVTQEMQHGGDLWNPTVFGKPYFNKPPLKMWLSLIPVKLFGATNFGFRFIDALAGLLSTLILYIFARTVYQSRVVGFVAALSLVTSRAYIFHHGVRTATQDSLVNFLNLVSMILAWRLISILRRESADTSLNRKKVLVNAVAGGISVGIAVMTKNIVGFIPLFLIGLFLLMSGELKGVWQRGKLPVALVIGLGMLIPALYIVPHCLSDYGLCKVMFGDEVVDRATVGYHNQREYLFYVKRLLLRAGPPPELFIPGILLATGFWIYRRERRYLLPLVWGIVPVILFSLVPSRLQWYVAPAFPGLALLSGIAFSIALEQFIKRGAAWWNGASSVFGSTLAFTAFFFFSCYGLASSLYGMVDRVQVRDINLALELITREILATPELNQLKLLSYKEMDLARNERVYLHRISKREEFNNLAELTSALSDRDVGFVLVPATDFEKIASIRKIVSYKFLAPEFNRKTWDLFISYSPAMKSLESPTQRIDLEDQASLLYGWSSSQVFAGKLVKRISGNEAALVLPTNRAHEVSSTNIKFTVGLAEPLEIDQASTIVVVINSQEVGQLQINGANLKEYSLLVPPGIFKTGKSTIVLRSPSSNPVVIREVSVSLETGLLDP